MLAPSFRRVVTAQGPNGRSIISHDGPAPAVEWPGWPGRGVTFVWSEKQAPVSNANLATPEERGETVLIPTDAGMSFIVMHIPPESEIEDLAPAQREQATIPVARTFPGAYELDTSKGYFMHGTDTMDWLILLSGELTLLVDDGEVTLKPFDTVIQGGTNHGWINRGSVPAVIAAVGIAAEALDRGAYADTAQK
jgi:mannose-6-phosphate isomerase-like protein (cupin superfamily)